MQSSLILNSSSIQNIKIGQLNLRLKKWRNFALSFFIIVLILSTIIIVSNISEKSQQKVYLQQQVLKVSQTCTSFNFNNTNLTQFRWSIKYNTTDQNQQNQFLESQSTKVISLNLSQNLLKQFSYNNLPDLIQLKLFTKKIFQNSYLETVSNNNFPKLQNFSIPRVKTFSNNYLPSLINFQQENFFYVNYFDNNYMPTLNGSRNFLMTYSCTNNTLGLQGLRFDLGNPGFQFHDNTLPELKSFQIYCWEYIQLISSSKIMNNIFPNLQSLALSCNILDFNQSKKLSKLQDFTLKSTGIKQLSNGTYPQLLLLKTQTYNLKYFTNNHFPLLENLQLNSWELVNVCEGNYMPDLKRVFFYQTTKLTNIECLRNAQNLQYLSLVFVSASIQNFYLPKLIYLSIDMQNMPIFSDSFFPSIETVSIQGMNFLNSFKNSSITFGNSLKSLKITGSNLQQLSFDIQMPNLADIYVQSSNLISLNCSSFKNAKNILLPSNKLKDDIIDMLIDCNFKNIMNLYLDGNLISDKVKARGKLSSKYPNCYISM